jgi:hypothetical protein
VRRLVAITSSHCAAVISRSRPSGTCPRCSRARRGVPGTRRPRPPARDVVSPGSSQPASARWHARRWVISADERLRSVRADGSGRRRPRPPPRSRAAMPRPVRRPAPVTRTTFPRKSSSEATRGGLHVGFRPRHHSPAAGARRDRIGARFAPVTGLSAGVCRREGGVMPEKETLGAGGKRIARKGRRRATQAGEFVREEIHHIREGKHGARSTKQAIAIGLSKARRSGRAAGAARAREEAHEAAGRPRRPQGPDSEGPESRLRGVPVRPRAPSRGRGEARPLRRPFRGRRGRSRASSRRSSRSRKFVSRQGAFGRVQARAR